MIEQGVYRHFKGGQYDVIGIADCNPLDLGLPTGASAEDFQVVITIPLGGNRRMRVRSIENFTEHVERDIEVDGAIRHYSGPRFVKMYSNQTGPA